MTFLKLCGVFLLFVQSISLAKTQIAVVGAGPVGIYVGVQIKLFDPETDVHIFEKGKEYTRDNTVLLKNRAFKTAHPDKAFREMLKKFGKKEKILKIQKDLTEFALKLGVNFHYDHFIEHPSQITSEYPDVKFIIAADGAHSTLRKIFVPEEKTRSKNLEYVAQVKYLVKGDSRELGFWLETLQLSAEVDYPFIETVKKDETTGQTQVILNIVLSGKEYQEFGKIQFKDPVRLNDPEDAKRLPEKLIRSIHTWIKHRGELTKEQLDEESITVTSTNLPEYFAPKVTFNLEDKRVLFIVGDAAFGVPFFRSASNGFETANYLAALIHKQIDATSKMGKFAHPKKYDPNELETYQHFVNALQTREKMTAHWRAFGAQLLRIAAKTYRGSNVVAGKFGVDIPGLWLKIQQKFSRKVQNAPIDEIAMEELNHEDSRGDSREESYADPLEQFIVDELLLVSDENL